MIVLSASQSVEVSLGNNAVSNQMMCVSSFRNTTSTSITPSRTITLTNGVTPVELVSSPSGSDQRIIDFLSIYNNDARSNTAIVKIKSSSSTFTLISSNLSPGEKLEYQEGIGFRVISNGYAVKTHTAFDGINSVTGLKMISLKRDFTNSVTSSNRAQEITDLRFPILTDNQYWFRYIIFYDTNATTTGTRFNVYGDSVTPLYYQYKNTLTSTSETLANSLSGFNAASLSNATSAATSGNVAQLEGNFTAVGTSFLRINCAAEFTAPEVGSIVTIKAGSFLQYHQLT